MNKNFLIFGIILLIPGLAGVASLLIMELSMPAEAAAVLKERFTAEQLKFLPLVNPSIFLFEKQCHFL